MARTFNGTSDVVALSAGASPVTTGATTWVAVVRISAYTASTSNPLSFLDSGGSVGGSIRISSTGGLSANISSSIVSPSTAMTVPTGTWVLLAIVRAAGTVTTRFLMYRFDTDTWTIFNSSGTNAGSATSLTTVGLGADPRGVSYTNGDVEAAATFASQLGDDRIASLTVSFAAWLSAAPSSMWVLDQQATTQRVVDWAGGGANQSILTGTTVSTNSVPILGYGHPVIATGKRLAPDLIEKFFIPYSGNNSNTLTTPSLTPANGEVIVVKMQTWATGTAMGSVTGGSQTWTSQVVEAPGGFNGWVGISTTTITGFPGSMTVSATPAASCGHSMVVERWTNAQLAVTPAVGSGTAASSAPSATVTTTGPNSVVSWLVYDNNNRDPSTRAYRSSAVDEALDDNHTGTNGVTYYAYQQAPSAGSQTIGLSAPNTMQWVIAGIEIQAPSTGVAGTTLTAQPGGSRPGGSLVAINIGLVATTQPGAALPGGSLCSITVGSSSTLTAVAGGTAPAGSADSVSFGAVLSVQSGGTVAGASPDGLSTGTAAVAQPAATLSAAVPVTATTGTLVTVGSGGAVPAGTQSTVTQATGLSVTPGGVLPTGAPVALLAGTVLVAFAGGAVSAGTTSAVTLGSATAANAQPAGSVPGGSGVALRSGNILASQSGRATPAGAACTITLGTPGTFTLTAQPGTIIPAGSPAQQAFGTTLSGQPGSAAAHGSSITLTAMITLAAAAGASASAGSSVAQQSGTAVIAVPTITLTGASWATTDAATALIPMPGIGFTGAGFTSFTAKQALNVLGGGTVTGSSPVIFAGGAPVLRRPGILTPGATRSDPMPGSRPYPRLTAGTLRGPTYSGG